MRQIHAAKAMMTFLVGGVVLLAISGAAQEGRRPSGEDLKRLGMDERTYLAHFGILAHPSKAVAPEIRTPDDLAKGVTSIRLFLTAKVGVVIGEVVAARPTALKELPLSVDGRSTVLFLDGGVPPDKAAGDGVFTAQFPLDVQALFDSLKQDLAGFASAVRADGSALVRRGPRDLVPAKEAAEALKRQNPEMLSRLLASADKLATIREPLQAARALDFDITKKPLVVLPGTVFDKSLRFRVPELFEFPLFPRFPRLAAVAIDEDRSLMVVHTGVVEDSGRTFDACTGTGTAGGVWSFGYLMREMAKGTGVAPEDYVLHWLSTWQTAQEANGFVVDEPGRGSQLDQRVIQSWRQISPGSVLNVDFFPARLMAIVNRPDLADRIGYGTAGSAGEGRLVFGLVDKSSGSCVPMPFTVIFEYGIKGGSCSAVKAWHQRWKDLDANPVGTPAYNTALALITKDFTDHGTNPAQTPNQSSLNQLRTNENALNPTWQLREFRLQGPGGSVPAGLLDLVTVKQTPDDSLNNSATLAVFFQQKEPDILGDRHVVPERFPNVLDRFLGARSNVDFPPFSFFWNAADTGLTNFAEARRKFSLNTCNGCHAGETQTSFTHIGSAGTRPLGSPAARSGFLTGIDVTVPVTGGVHHYEDLAERQDKMSRILTTSCFALLAERSLPFVH